MTQPPPEPNPYQPQPYGSAPDSYEAGSYAANPYGANPYGPGPAGPSPHGANPYGANPYGIVPGPPTAVPSHGDPGLDQPWYGIGWVDAVVRGFRLYARFRGLASRGEYWWWQLTVSVLVLVPLIGTVAMNGSDHPRLGTFFGVLVYGFAIAVVLPTIAVGVRRLHDTGQSGALILLNLIPTVGGIIVLVLMAQPSRPQGAQYAAQPATAPPPWSS